jgi:excisionase family DNA binding protein
MTPDADLSDPIRTADETAPTGGAPPTEGLPDFLTVVEAARLLRIGRTSAYLLAQQWLYSDGRKGLPVVRVGRQLRVPRRALERLAGGELTPVPAPPSELRGVPVPSTATPTGAPTDDDTPPDAEADTRAHAPSAKPRARARDARRTQTSLFPTDR